LNSTSGKPSIKTARNASQFNLIIRA
jgi:hypothetical protein